MKTFADLRQAIAALPDSDFAVFVDTSNARPVEGVPPELAKLYATWGMLAIEVKESIWPRPKELEVAPAWRFAFGFKVFPPEGPQRAFLKRASARFFFVLTEAGVGTWQEGEAVEDEPFDAIDCILRQIDDLQRGIERIRLESMSAERLVEAGRAVSWSGPTISAIVSGLEKRPPEELAPHVRELVDALLPGDRFSMAALNMVAAAGPAAYRGVAETILAFEKSRPWVIQLLGKMKDASAPAVARYRAALDGTSDDDDELEQAFIAVKEVATEPAARALVPLIRARLDAWEPEHRASAIALLGHLGEPIVPLVSAALGEIDDDDLGALLCALEGLPVAELAPSLLARLRALDPKSRNALAWIEALVDLAIEDRALMEPILRDHFVSRGGRWQTRAEAILARWA
ncbi:MAG: hypothetical protein JST00_39165 [Deltaproteobacteria bacterium]|nr:hypothetical protein [Deltaproteobacteria bacterium]